jgi:flavin-binding protein dodecin
MVKKGIELIGTSDKSVSDAVKTAVEEAALTLKGIEWLKVLSYTLELENAEIKQHQVRLMVYFDVKR